MQSAPEIWKDIPGYEGRYAVSTLGRVFSYRVNRCLRPGKMSGGHLSVALGRNNSHCVHELVLIAFKGPRPHKHDARHLDGVPDNNTLDNLCWSTRTRNSQDKKWHKGQKNYKLSPAEVLLIRINLLKGFMPTEIARSFGVSKGTIYAIRDGKFHCDV